MTEREFSRHDIDNATKLGELMALVSSLHTKFDSLHWENKKENEVIWSGIEKIRGRQDEQDKAVSNQNGVIKGVVAVGAFIQALVMVFVAWIKQ
jgi:hypothetical protein